MDEADLRHSAPWRLAVWGLRVMGPGLAVVAVGLIALVWSKGTGQATVAAGIGIYLVGVVITVAGIVLVYREVPPPRPNFLDLRWSLLHDAVHARPASAGQRAEGPGPPGERGARSPHIESLRRSAQAFAPAHPATVRNLNENAAYVAARVTAGAVQGPIGGPQPSPYHNHGPVH